MYQNIIDNLNTKDANQFKQLIKLYETKNYKKGLKQADKLLESIPSHPETLSLKGIFTYFTGSKDEGRDICKKALDKGMKSDICWHIYGIIHRANRNYKDAVNCYKFALMYAPDNVQILKDVALLQIQIRDLAGHSETRRKLLQQKESLVINWVSYAVAEHLNGEFDNSLKLLDSIMKITADNSLKKQEKSEFLIYYAFVYQEAKKYKESVEFLLKYEKEILDKSVMKELLVENYIQLKDFEKGTNVLNELMEGYPNNGKYHETLIRILKLQKSDVNVVEELEKVLEKIPTQNLKLTILTESSGDKFKAKFQEYITPYFRKSLPSLFREIKQFYQHKQHESKIPIIEKVLEENYKSLEGTGKLVGQEQVETPNVLLWNTMVLAQHYDRIGKTDLAMEYINKAIEHTPTLLELYLVKAKIYKHRYNYEEAFNSVNKARNMDYADRYLCNKAIKYVLRLNRTSEAEGLMKLFIKDNEGGNVFDLQTLWYEIALGQAYLRQKHTGAALKQYNFIEKHFSDMNEDQFDFHAYCMRKYTLKTYIDMIRYEDDLRNSKFYINAAAPHIQTLINYKAVAQAKKDEESKEEELLATMNSKQKKAYKREKEKALQKQKKQEESQQGGAKKDDPIQQQRDKLDLDGKQIIEKLTNPIQDADIIAQNLINLNITDPKLVQKAYSVLVDLYIIRGKELLCLKAVNKLVKVNYCPNETHLKKITAINFLQKRVSELTGAVQDLLKDELKTLTGGKSIEELNKQFLGGLDKFNAELYKLKIGYALEQIKKEDFLTVIEKLALTCDAKIENTIAVFDILLENQETIKPEVREQLIKQYPESDYFVDWVKRQQEKEEKEKQEQQEAEKKAQEAEKKK